MMIIPKFWNYIFIEYYEVQSEKLKIIFSRYLENITNNNYPFSLHEEALLSLSI